MKKMEFIPSSEMKCPKCGFLKLIIGWGYVGKYILYETLLSTNSMLFG